MRLRTVLAGTLLGAVAIVALRLVEDADVLRAERCVAEVGDVRAQVDLEQAQWAALMAARAEQRGLPARATTIAIATAFQESKLHNIDYGDRDSVGLFQQRPSQGWGTVEQILDPYHAIGRFYDGLVEVPGYEGLEITVAAQAVQRSAFPDAYAQHEPRSRALASALRGFSPAAFSCTVRERTDGDAATVAADLDRAFGGAGVVHDGAVASVPVAGEPEAAVARGWALAHYAVANAVRLRVTEVSFAGRTWTAEDSADGWRSSDAPADTVSVATG